jgi:hypothetical protein
MEVHMKRFFKWVLYLFLGLIALMAIGGLAKNHPETAIGIGACIAAFFIGTGLRRLFGKKKPVDTETGQAMVLGHVIAGNPLDDTFDSDAGGVDFD